MQSPSARVSSLLLAPLLVVGLAGCNGPLIGNFFVLAVSVGIFYGTLGLGRAPRTPSVRPSSAETSASDLHR